MFTMSDGHEDPMKFLKNRANHNNELKEKAINAQIGSMVLSKAKNLSSPPSSDQKLVETNNETLQKNLDREDKTSTYIEDHFEVSCGIGKDINKPRATRGRRSEINCKNKKIAKILNYNSKRREFIRDDE